jgi:hypothetical protein
MSYKIVINKEVVFTERIKVNDQWVPGLHFWSTKKFNLFGFVHYFSQQITVQDNLEVQGDMDRYTQFVPACFLTQQLSRGVCICIFN